jgi:hypothetical protein
VARREPEAIGRVTSSAIGLIEDAQMDDSGGEPLQNHDVIPAKAGIHRQPAAKVIEKRWMPAFAGMTSRMK